jgi:hypothetical protein
MKIRSKVRSLAFSLLLAGAASTAGAAGAAGAPEAPESAGDAAAAKVTAANVTVSAVGRAYFLSPEGSDEWDCTDQSPCASLAKVTAAAEPGDTLIALAGKGDDAWLQKMLDIRRQDTGRYRGMIIQGIEGKRQVRGFVRLATTWGTDLEPAFSSAALGIPNLVDAINAQTGISATVEKHVFIGSREFFQSPFLYITASRAFELSEAEIQALGDYMRGGGFIFADNALPMFEFSQVEAVMRRMFSMALGRQGRLRRIPNSHSLYRSFYEFDGPPLGMDEVSRTYSLDGAFLGQRLVGVFADKGYVHSWALNFGNEPQLRFGINAVVFAMKQAGSVAGEVPFLARSPQ